tara:strand:+ start:622 stop:882 length:261 start_codon:yes stop_codon:yes gene_type:complete
MSKVNSYDEICEAIPQCLRVLDKHYGAVPALLMLEPINLKDTANSFTSFSPDKNVIWGSFCWGATPQGHKYWLKIARSIELRCEDK